MAKKMSKLDIMNVMGDAADKKAKMPKPDMPENDGDEDDMPAPKAKKPLQGKQIAAIKNKGKY